MNAPTMETAPFAPADVDAVCAIEDGRTLTWRQWNDDANRLASSLDRLGIRAGDVIAVRVHTRLEWLTISLAAAKLDAVIVAVNYRLAPVEATYILRDCKVRAVFVDDTDLDALLDAWVPLNLAAVISLDGSAHGAVDFDDLLRDGDPAHRPATDLARLIIYSSGTTGAPKGAPLNNWQSDPDPAIMGDYQLSVLFDGAALGPGVFLVNLPMHHGAGPGFTRAALASGSTVVFQRRFDPETMLALIEEHQVSHWVSVPTMLARILKLPADVRGRHDLRSLRFVLGGAAPFAPELKLAVMDYLGDVLYETYGATEAGMMTGSTPADLRRRPATSGRPFRHVELRILDDAGVPLPQGSTGEIAVRTPAVISGYIGRGALGPDKLDADGFYRTGDVGYVDDEGYLFICDRITDMIIAGGVNIYPAEVEAALMTHPAVANVAVIGIPDSELGEQPLAFVQAVAGAHPSPEELLDHCAGRLAKYKWPRRFEIVEEIPTNPMGKVLKNQLREPFWTKERHI